MYKLVLFCWLSFKNLPIFWLLLRLCHTGWFFDRVGCCLQIWWNLLTWNMSRKSLQATCVTVQVVLSRNSMLHYNHCKSSMSLQLTSSMGRSWSFIPYLLYLNFTLSHPPILVPCTEVISPCFLFTWSSPWTCATNKLFSLLNWSQADFVSFMKYYQSLCHSLKKKEQIQRTLGILLWNHTPKFTIYIRG